MDDLQEMLQDPIMFKLIQNYLRIQHEDRMKDSIMGPIGPVIWAGPRPGESPAPPIASHPDLQPRWERHEVPQLNQPRLMKRKGKNDGIR